MKQGPTELTTHIRRRVSDLGYELVDLKRGGAAQRPLLQVRIDRPDSAPGAGVTVADCAVVSRALEAWLDDGRVFGERYILEVSSPGVERPVRWPEHWRRFVGHDVNVRIMGRGRTRMTIVRVSDDDRTVFFQPVGLGPETEEIAVELEHIRDATLAIDWT